MEQPSQHQPTPEPGQQQTADPGRLRRFIAATTMFIVASGGVAAVGGEAFAADGSPEPQATTSATPLSAETPAANPADSPSPTTSPSPTESPSPTNSPSPTEAPTPSPTPTAVAPSPVSAPSSAPTETISTPPTSSTTTKETAPTAQELSIATWNLLGDSHVEAGKAIGGDPHDRVELESKMALKHNADIYLFQEVTSPEQRKNIESHMKDTYIFAGDDHNQNPIAFKKEFFTLEKTMTFRYPYYDTRTPAGRDGVGTIVVLRDKRTDKLVIVMGDHTKAHEDHPNKLSDAGGALCRLETAKIERRLELKLITKYPDAVFFNGGDQNEGNVLLDRPTADTPIRNERAFHGNRNLLWYCQETAPIKVDGKKVFPVQDAIDMAKGLEPAHCPDKSASKKDPHNDNVDWMLTNPATFFVKNAKYYDIPFTSDHPLYKVTGYEQPQVFGSKSSDYADQNTENLPNSSTHQAALKVAAIVRAHLLNTASKTATPGMTAQANKRHTGNSHSAPNHHGNMGRQQALRAKSRLNGYATR